MIVFGHQRNRARRTGRAKIVGFREYTDTATIVKALADR